MVFWLGQYAHDHVHIHEYHIHEYHLHKHHEHIHEYIYMNIHEYIWIYMNTYTWIPCIYIYMNIPYTWPCSYTYIPKKYPTAPNWSGNCLLQVAIVTEYQQRRHYDGPSPWWKNRRFLCGINHIFSYPTHTLTESPWLIACPQGQWWDWLHRPSLHYPFSISESIC